MCEYVRFESDLKCTVLTSLEQNGALLEMCKFCATAV
jgi:hypothetical protein